MFCSRSLKTCCTLLLADVLIEKNDTRSEVCYSYVPPAGVLYGTKLPGNAGPVSSGQSNSVFIQGPCLQWKSTPLMAWLSISAFLASPGIQHGLESVAVVKAAVGSPSFGLLRLASLLRGPVAIFL